VLLKAIASPSMIQVLSRQGFQATGNTPEQFGAFIASELSLWGKLIRESGAKVDD
jgi:tripartite-type tricarboxylate transporter receptor subunit TctC